MSISCDPDELLNGACCFVDMPWKTRQAIRILNWCALLNGETMDCNPQSLVIAASNFTSRLSAAQMDGIETYLSCQIANAGGGSGSLVQYFNGHYGGGQPTVTPTAAAATADDLDDPFNHWIWDGSTWGPPF